MRGEEHFYVVFFLVIALSFSTIALAVERNNNKSDCLGNSCIDANRFTKEQVEGNELVKKFCTSCHTENRVFSKLQELQKDNALNYEKNVRNIVIKKIRMASGEISRQDGRKILEYLVAL